MNSPQTSSLGRAVAAPTRYAPELLFAIARAGQRAALGIGSALPFHGVDIWNAYELSWLDLRGKPCVALATLRVPAGSPQLIESKSLKLYLGSFGFERIERDDLGARIEADLSGAAGAPVTVALSDPGALTEALALAELAGESLDALELEIDHYGPPRDDFLTADAQVTVTETLTSALFKSNCPVTGQPDWASVQVRYRGPRIDHAGLLRYLVSYRDHSDFHEACVERIFVDLLARCAPVELSVYARYTRRGGLDINPYRSTGSEAPANPRGSRQ